MIKPHWCCPNAVIIKISSIVFFLFFRLSSSVWCVSKKQEIYFYKQIISVMSQRESSQLICLISEEKTYGKTISIFRLHYRALFCTKCSGEIFFVCGNVIDCDSSEEKTVRSSNFVFAIYLKMRETMAVKLSYCLLARGKLAGGILRFVCSLSL